MTTTTTPKQLRFAVIQMDPQVERVQDNIAKARRLTQGLTPGQVDLVCFPEMAFTGYVFPSFKALEPHLERPADGPTSDFCRELAIRLSCYVVAGYPERLSHDKSKIASDALGGRTAAADGSITEKAAEIQFAGNSAVLYGPDGQLVGGYRKSNLYEADKPWAQAGTGFTTFNLPGLPKLSIAICMDLNPRPVSEWADEHEPFEIADFCIKEDVGLLVVLCAWLDSEEEADSSEVDLGTARYWCYRLSPLYKRRSKSSPRTAKETVVVVCDRVGFERGTQFAGTSSILRLRQGSGRPEVVGMMTRREEACRVWSVDVRD